MRGAKFRFRDEPWTSVLAFILLSFPIAIIVLVSSHHFSGLGPRSLQLCVPFVLIAPGVMVLRRLRAPDSLAYVLLGSTLITAAYLIAGCFTALTGFTFSKYNPHAVPRLASLNYFYVALVASAIAAFAAMYYQKRLREIDG